MSACRRIPLPLLSMLTLLLPPAARAEIVFDTVPVTPSTWPWPAAVAVEDWGFAWRAVLWVDGIDVTWSRTEGGTMPVYHETVTQSVNVDFLDAVADGAAEIHACFTGTFGGTQGLRYAHRNSEGIWSVEWVVTGAGQGRSCSIAVRDDTAPVIVYIDASVPNQRHLRYAWRSGPGWIINTVDTSTISSEIIATASLATDQHGALHIAWSRGAEVRYAQGPTSPVEIVATGVSPVAIHVAHGRDGQPRAAVQDGHALKFATRTAGGWTVEPVLPGRANVEKMAFAIGIDGVPCLVYQTDEPEDPLLCALPVRGSWREQRVSDEPLHGALQWPSIGAGLGTWANLDFVVAWIGDGLKLSADVPFLDAFATTRLRACPDGDLLSTVELYDRRGNPLQWPIVLDFTAPGVMDTVDFCHTWRDTLRRWTDADGTADIRLHTGGAVAGGIAITATPYAGSDPLHVERSAPMAGVDLEGNGSVTSVDGSLFDELLGTADPRGDLDFDGDVDASDRQVLLDHLWHACTTSDVRNGDDDPATADAVTITGLRPNPAGGPATIAWRAPARTPVRLTVVDAAGRRIRAMPASESGSGSGEVVWDGRDNAGRTAPDGVYFIRLQAGERVALQRLVRLR